MAGDNTSPILGYESGDSKDITSGTDAQKRRGSAFSSKSKKYHPLLQGKAQRRARQAAADARNEGFRRAEETYAGTAATYDSYKQLGEESVSAVRSLFGDPGSVKGLPGYQFRMEQGQGAIENVAGKKGQLFGGNTLQELVRYGQEFATAEYDNELKRRFAGVQAGLEGTKGADAANLNLAEIQAGRGQAAARQYEDESKYIAGLEQSGRDIFGSWFGGSGPFGQATSSSMGGGMGSDRSIKENIVRVGMHLLGIGLYLFDYKQQYKATWGYGRYLGVMADEVAAVLPAAVSTHADGYQLVNYSMLQTAEVSHDG